jgi:hypothetical protein
VIWIWGSRAEWLEKNVATQNHSRKTEALNASHTLDQNGSQIKNSKYTNDLVPTGLGDNNFIAATKANFSSSKRWTCNYELKATVLGEKLEASIASTEGQCQNLLGTFFSAHNS